MKIKRISIQEKHSFKAKPIDLEDVTILYSEKNSTGKTTLMRAILYGLGFPVPDTELVKFKNYEIKLNVINNNIEYFTYRKDQLLRINNFEYDLPTEQTQALSYLFGISNIELLNNLLGTIYFDQEKGWTLLNRGTIIGSNRFSIEEFFRGLNNDESDESYKIASEIKALESKISQYRLMLNVADYQATLNIESGNTCDYQSYDQELQTQILKAKQELESIEKEISTLTEIIKKNKNFCDYLSQKKIYIKIPNSDTPLRITKENLLEYDVLEELNLARKSMLISDRNKLKRRIAELESKIEAQITFVNIPTIDEELTHRLANIQGLNSIQIKNLLNDLQKKKEKLSKRLIEKTKFNNLWISEAYDIAKKYAELLQLPDDIKLDIFTHNLKSKSGAILHKLVFIYKLAYIKLLSKKCDYSLPIFCDSPSGREVEQETIESMLKILKSDFNNHQLIIASIYNYKDIFNNSKIVTMDGTLFNKQTLLD